MSEASLVPKTISDNYLPVVKMVVASAVDEQRSKSSRANEITSSLTCPSWEKGKQNTPCFSAEVITGLAGRKKTRERMIFIFCGAAGLRIGEALGYRGGGARKESFLFFAHEQQKRRNN